MATVIRLDTHVVVWLYAGATDRLSASARRLLDTEEPVMSPAVELELTYLREIDRLTVGGADIVSDLRARIGLTLSDVPFSAVVASAGTLSWTRDPFDRLIVADAIAAGAGLLTKDTEIRKNFSAAAW